jgi:hypothetical protein
MLDDLLMKGTYHTSCVEPATRGAGLIGDLIPFFREAIFCCNELFWKMVKSVKAPNEPLC